MDADAQTRQVLDRMAIDFAQMVKRSDVDYYLSLRGLLLDAHSVRSRRAVRNLLQPGNDTIAFYSTVPGYYPSSGSQSPVSLVAYRVNSDSTSSAYNKMERMGKGLVWNAVSPTRHSCRVFMPIPIASPLPIAELPDPTPSPTPTPAWPRLPAPRNPTPDSEVEVIGPQVFRFEYYYLLKGQTESECNCDYLQPASSAIRRGTHGFVHAQPLPTATPTPTGTQRRRHYAATLLPKACKTSPQLWWSSRSSTLKAKCCFPIRRVRPRLHKWRRN